MASPRPGKISRNCERQCLEVNHSSSNGLPRLGLPAKLAKRAVDEALANDINPRRNLASFVTTEMEPEAEQLLMAGMRKNFIDADQYRGSNDVKDKCVEMISKLWNAPGKATGCATAGSSEAIMLAGLAMRHNWREWRKSHGLPSDRPNCVFGSNVQVCWHKMCTYFDIECREADVTAEELVLTPERAKPLIDQNTIGVCPILGSTFNGEFADIKAIHDMVVALNEEKGWQVPIHVDAASGGFIAPFLNPELLWDFRLPNVKSINASGHKFGLVYAGLGWVLWREPRDLPKDLSFSVNYLGGDQPSFTLNFSKSAAPIIAQYYNFLRLGFEGYRQTMQDCMHVAAYLREKLLATGKVRIVDKQHMPLVGWALTEEFAKKCTVFEVQARLDAKGWSVPAYTCPKGAEELAIMRVVVKNNFSLEMCDVLLQHIEEVFEAFDCRSASSRQHSKVSSSPTSRHLYNQRHPHREHNGPATDDSAASVTKPPSPDADDSAASVTKPPSASQPRQSGISMITVAVKAAFGHMLQVVIWCMVVLTMCVVKFASRIQKSSDGEISSNPYDQRSAIVVKKLLTVLEHSGRQQVESNDMLKGAREEVCPTDNAKSMTMLKCNNQQDSLMGMSPLIKTSLIIILILICC